MELYTLIDDETDQVLVRSIVEIATKLGKKTIAEFVENPEVITKLREMGATLAQGYIFGKPEKKHCRQVTLFQSPGEC